MISQYIEFTPFRSLKADNVPEPYEPQAYSHQEFPGPHEDGAPVLKKLIGRLFGFDREISGLQEQVKQLSWDTAYGMWTRPAFIQFCQVMPRSMRTLAFLDLDRIHALDQELGYTEVDRRIQATFSVSFRRSDVVARWYSGDEIVILFDSDRQGAEKKLAELAEAAGEEGLSFKYAIGEWDVGKQLVEDVVEQIRQDPSGR